MLVTGILLLLAAVPAAGLGSTLLLRAALMERRGRLVLAREAARRGGFLLAGGSALQALALLLLSVHPWFGVCAAATTLASGFVALLAGLSGKPRPSGRFAVALWVASVLLGLGALCLVSCARC